MIALGIDPGKVGGLAVVGPDGPIEYCAMPATEHDVIEVVSEYAQIAQLCVIERVAATPQMGVVSAFTFGRGYGLLRGAVAAARIRTVEVAPGVWQRALGCLSRGDKNVTKAAAQRLFPTVPKITHKIADALLLAEWRRTRAT